MYLDDTLVEDELREANEEIRVNRHVCTWDCFDGYYYCPLEAA
jgi:hypothetical protein